MLPHDLASVTSEWNKFILVWILWQQKTDMDSVQSSAFQVVEQGTNHWKTWELSHAVRMDGRMMDGNLFLKSLRFKLGYFLIWFEQNKFRQFKL